MRHWTDQIWDGKLFNFRWCGLISWIAQLIVILVLNFIDCLELQISLKPLQVLL